ncbi:MAG: DNA topoisomerase 3 [bacterium]
MPNGKALIITEKPSVARDIAKSMGGFIKKKESLESESAIITWAIGHLVTLAEPDDYDKRYRFWLLERLPIIPEQFQLKVIPKTAARFEAIASLLKRKEVSEVINACDAGREGELIFRYIYQEAGCKKPIRRLWLSSMTDSAIRAGFGQLRTGAEMDLLAESARCRSESDWLVGINATRAFTRRFGMLLSVGRVQTPTLAILVHRELEIQAFLPETYFELFATFTAANGRYQGKWFTRGSDRFTVHQEGIEVEAKVQNQPGMITSLERKESIQQPPLLFDLAELQREANRRFSYSAKRTLDIAQSLYEKHKLITYPRTDCHYLSSDMIPQLPAVISNLASGEWEEFAKELLSLGKLPISKRLVDDARITDHHAIIPTLSKPKLTGLKPEETRIFDLIVRRFLAAFFPAARWENTRLVTEVEGEKFRTEGRKLNDIGWLKVYDRPNREELLPDLGEGEAVQVVETQLEEKQTAPPPRFNDATLLSAMEGAGKLLDDEELREAMKERGLGTSATRAAIIERLIDVEFVQRESKAIIPTTKGIELIRAIEIIQIPELASPELTGNWEHQLVQIEKGQTPSSHFMEEIVRLTREVVEKVKESKEVEAFRAAVNEPLGNCPLCGGEIRETKMAYSCSNWKEQGCKFAIWKRVAGKILTRGQANELLSKGRVGPLFGFRSRAGKPFRAILVLQGEKVVFEFLNDRPGYVRKEKAEGAVEEGVSATLSPLKRKVVRRKTSALSKPRPGKSLSSQTVAKAPAAKKTARKRTVVSSAISKGTAAVDKADADKETLPKKAPRPRKSRLAGEEKKEEQT